MSLIYTVGDDDREPYNPSTTVPPVLSVSVGEDFAECSWPIVLKCKPTVTRPQLLTYVDALADAARRGFWMNAQTAPTLFWEWTGSVPPGMETTGTTTAPNTARVEGTGHRSDAGTGTECGLYLMDDAARWQRPGFYGRIRGHTAVSASVGEDFAVSRWPVVVKVEAGTNRATVARYLADLAWCIRNGLFVNVASAAA